MMYVRDLWHVTGSRRRINKQTGHFGGKGNSAPLHDHDDGDDNDDDDDDDNFRAPKLIKATST